jgi:Uma2 family endonuclease
MAVSYAPSFTVEEYLALEAVAKVKHEFCGGRILAMAGAQPAHNVIATNLTADLTNALEEMPCLTFSSDQRVLSEAAQEYFYPDLTVTCLEPRFRGPSPDSLTNPQILVEVLSPSTERYDRGDKWSAYRLIPSLTDYVMVSSQQREVEHFQRAADGSGSSRTLRDGEVRLSNGVTLQVGRIYRRVPGFE